MSYDFDDRLVDTLNAVAEQTETSRDWDRVVADANPIRERSTVPVWRSTTLAVAAAVAMLVGFGGVLWSASSRGEVTVADSGGYLLPGELLVSNDPLVVVSAVGPELEFNTGDLGTELRLDVVDEVDDRISAMMRRALEALEWPEASVTKVTLIGEIEGEPWILMIIDGLGPGDVDAGGGPESNFRVRLLVGPAGGHGSGDPVPIDSLGLIAPPSAGPPEEQLIFSPGDAWISWDMLPAETAVVTLVDSERHLWIRPRSGTAIAPVTLEAGGTFMLQALDASGKTISRRTETVDDEYQRGTGDSGPEYEILLLGPPDKDEAVNTGRECIELSREAEIALDEALALQTAEVRRSLDNPSPQAETERSEMLDTVAMLTARAEETRQRFQALGC